MNRTTKLLIVNVFFILAITWAIVNAIGAPEDHEIEVLVILSIVIIGSGIGNAIVLRGAPNEL